MKALPLLKYFKTKKGTTYKMMCKIDEAVKELEDLKNRSCKNCNKNGCEVYYHLNSNIENINSFCCNQWQEK